MHYLFHLISRLIEDRWETKMFFLFTFSFIVFCISGFSKAEETDEYILEDTVVTATKTGETNLQETPMSITVFSDEFLDNTHAYKLTELSQMVPNAQFEFLGPFMVGFVRGIGTTKLDAGGEQSVGFYLDGIYLPRGFGGNANFFDVERVEVLRGPQGTLWGRNSTGGAVNVITKMPTDELEVKLGLRIGNYDNRRVDATFSGPLIQDKVKARLSFSDGEHDGYVHNLVGDDLSDENYTGVRGAVQFTPTDNVDIQLKGDFFKSHDHAYGSKLMSDQGVMGGIAMMTGTPNALLMPDDFWTAAPNEDQSNKTEMWGISGTAEFKLPYNQVLRSISGYRDYEQDWFVDLDGTILDLVSLENRHGYSLFSQELQLNGTSERWKWLIGVYYIHQEDEFPENYTGFDVMAPGLVRSEVIDIETDGWAGFGNVSYAITDKLSVEAGVRYSYEKKEVDYTVSWNMPVPMPAVPLHDDNSWDDVTPKFGIQYRPNDEALLFATVSKGFKSGNFAPYNPPVFEREFDSESLWSYEAGFKTDWFNNRLRANGTYFYYDYTDMQVRSWLTGVAAVDTNAAESTIQGVELELLARPISPLTLKANISYLDAEYDDYIAADPAGIPVDASGNSLPYAPEWKLIFGAQYVIPMGDLGFLTIAGDLTWTDDQYFIPLKNDLAHQDDYTLVNGFVRFETADGHWSFEVFGKNLGDEEYLHNALTAFTSQDVVGTISPPRTYGFQAIYKF